MTILELGALGEFMRLRPRFEKEFDKFIAEPS